MYENLHWMQLKKLCLERQLNISACFGRDSYLKLLKDNDNMNNDIPKLIMNPTAADLASVNISHEGIRLDKLRSDLNSLVSCRKDNKGRTFQKKFNDGYHSYVIDTNENTIHFFGGCLGPICTTLRQEDKIILALARRYLDANTVAGFDGMRAEIN